MTRCARPAVAPRAPLIQIHRVYITVCDGLRLSVETHPEGWQAQVRDRSNGRTLYSAHRCSLRAAKVAAAEYAVFGAVGAAGQKTPEAMAQDLPWDESW